MDTLTIYHNGRCSKSRGALEILIEQNIPYTARWYMTEPLKKTELKRLLKKLGMKAVDLVRKNELIYKEQFRDTEHTESEWVSILIAHPELMERPIVEKGDKAIVARPPERVFEFI